MKLNLLRTGDYATKFLQLIKLHRRSTAYLQLVWIGISLDDCRDFVTYLFLN